MENNVHTACVMSKGDILQPEDFPVYAEMDTKIEIDLDNLRDDYTELFRKIIDPVLPKLIDLALDNNWNLQAAARNKIVLHVHQYERFHCHAFL